MTKPVEILGACTATVLDTRFDTPDQVFEAVHARAEQLRVMVDSLPVLISYIDPEQRYHFANATYSQWFAAGPAPIVGLHMSEVLGHEAYDLIRPYVEAALAGEAVRYTADVDFKAAGVMVIDAQIVPHFDRAKKVIGAYELVSDITDREHAKAALQASEDRFRNAFEDAAIGMALATDESNIVDANRAVCAMLGYSHDELVGKNFVDITHPEDSENCLRLIEQMFRADTQHCEMEKRYIRKDGSIIWAKINASVVNYSETKPKYAVIQIQDITEARQLSEQLTYQASHDTLTGLTNRRDFETRLKRALERLSAAPSGHVVAYIDLDQFKVINDTCGHVAGDELLRQLGRILNANLRTSDTLARLGGDEFGLLLENCSLENASLVVEKLHAAFDEFRFVWDDKHFNLGASIGLVPINEAATVSEILSQADAACYAAKEQGRNRTHVSSKDDKMLARQRGEMEWVAKINHALEENRLCLYFQTIIPLHGEHCGEHYELLLRMLDNDGKLVPPGAFLPAAERYNLSVKLDRWVIDTALRWLSGNDDVSNNLGLCSINLSGPSLGDVKLLEMILQRLEHSKVPAEKICFEVTETAAIANLATATHFINTLGARGCQFALDDFGSGLSSFAYLKTLPVDYLKIDGVFVKDMADDPIDFAMVKSINEIGHVMGKKTIAEFVENESILKKLKEIGVDFAQGYGIAKPRPIETMCCGNPIRRQP